MHPTLCRYPNLLTPKRPTSNTCRASTFHLPHIVLRKRVVILPCNSPRLQTLKINVQRLISVSHKLDKVELSHITHLEAKFSEPWKQINDLIVQTYVILATDQYSHSERKKTRGRGGRIQAGYQSKCHWLLGLQSCCCSWLDAVWPAGEWSSSLDALGWRLHSSSPAERTLDRCTWILEQCSLPCTWTLGCSLADLWLTRGVSILLS